MLGLAATGCNKENIADSAVVTSESTVYYNASGSYGSENLSDNDAWDAFLDRMFALAREGYEVTISGSSQPSLGATKEVVTYTTTSESDAKHWAKEKTQQGYTVSISYDNRTGVYTCTAIK